MATATWSSIGGSWSTAGLWSDGAVPVAGDTAAIGGTVDLSGIEVDGVRIIAGPVTQFNLLTSNLGTGSRTGVLGAGTVLSVGSSGSFGQILNNSTAFTNAGTISATGGGSVIVSDQGTFLNSGSMVASGGGVVTVYGVPTSSFLNTGTISGSGLGAFREAYVGSGFVNDGTIALAANVGVVASPTFSDFVQGTGIIALAGGEASFGAGAGGGQTIEMAGNSEIKLAAGGLAGPSALQATIAGFQKGDTIDLGTANIDGVALSGNTLSLSSKGTLVGSLRFANGYVTADFALGTPVSGSGDALLVSTRAVAPTALTLGGATAGKTVGDNATIDPLAGLFVLEPVAGQTLTASVTLSSAANGSLSGGGGSFSAASGTYSLSGTAAAVQAALEGLVFTPTQGQVAPGQTVLTGFAVAVVDQTGARATNTVASVVTTAIAPPSSAVSSPVIATTTSVAANGAVSTGTITVAQAATAASGSGAGAVTQPATSGTSTATGSSADDGAAGGNGGQGTILIDSGSVTTTVNGNSVVAMGGGAVTVNSNGSDLLYGGTGVDTVNSSGNAVIIGGGGPMTVNQTTGNDVVFAGKGGLTFNGGSGTDVVVGFGNAMTVNGGSGNGQYFGSGGSTITAGSGAQSVLVGNNGDRLFSAGGAGDLFGAGTGTVLMSGVGSTGNDVFFGAGGTGSLTFIAGSGNDIMGVGKGTNAVTLGAGRTTIFATSGTGATTITAGAGSADIGMGGASANLVIAAGSTARTFNVFNFVPGADKISLTGFGGATAANALATQSLANAITVLTLGDGTSIDLIGVTHANANVFG